MKRIQIGCGNKICLPFWYLLIAQKLNIAVPTYKASFCNPGERNEISWPEAQQ